MKIKFIIAPLLLLQIPWLSTPVEGKVYHITPIPGEPCSVNQYPCITLSQFVDNPNDYLESSTTLVFLVGIHFLHSELTVANIKNFTMTSAASVMIKCNDTGRFEFIDVSYVRITALHFSGCGGNSVFASSQIIVEGTMFRSKRNSRAALELVSATNAIIARSSFVDNAEDCSWNRILFQDAKHNGQKQLRSGGALIITKSNAVITESVFNYNCAGIGAAVFGELSDDASITITNSSFLGNDALVFSFGDLDGGGSLYFQYTSINVSTEHLPRVTIINSLFVANLGGVIGVNNRISLRISNSSFFHNCALMYGGVLLTVGSPIVSVDNCTFYDNFSPYGGVIAVIQGNSTSSTVSANRNNFYKNSAKIGGVLFAEDGGLFIFSDNDFAHNVAIDNGGAIAMNNTSVVYTSKDLFFHNVADTGAVIYTDNGAHTFVNSGIFIDNTVCGEGGIIDVGGIAVLTIENSTFIRNIALNGIGSIIDALTLSVIRVSDSKFINNSALGWVLLVADLGTIKISGSHFSNNEGGLMLVQLVGSSIFMEDTSYFNNSDPVLLYNSKLTFSGNNSFIRTTMFHDNLDIDSTLTAIQSLVVFNGSCAFIGNHAYSGGAIHATESSLYLFGHLTVANNTVWDTGGGIYLYQSGLHCFGCTLQISNNAAYKSGGGICAVSSVIKVHFDRIVSSVHFVNNSAIRGGAINFDSNAKLNIFRYRLHKHNTQVISFVGNSAVKGGVMYVNDAALCISSDFNKNMDSSECFFQVLTAFSITNPEMNVTTFKFEQNYAYQGQGSILFGGLLDRCAVSPFAEIRFKCNRTDAACLNQHISGVSYFNDISTAIGDAPSLISSEPVRACFCMEGNFKPNCSYQPQSIRVKKGELFTVSLVAVDQVNKTLEAVVHSYLETEKGGIRDGRLTWNTGTNCTNITFSVTSPYDNETIIVYAEGPCKDSKASLRKIGVEFEPCSCPVGFQINRDRENVECDCPCASELRPCLIQCNLTTNSLEKGNKNCWIAYYVDEEGRANSSGYLIHMHCPLDYCQPPSSNALVNLNIPDGSDTQCAHNRRGKLCGQCRRHFSLSLGSSRCIPCPDNWPAQCAAILVAAIVSGIILVGLILVLNLTVAVGTLNGIVFYANVVAANSAIFLPSDPCILTTVIAWLNLDIGFDTCLYKGMDAYWKTWLQFLFPAYVILLVVIIIIICEKSTKFAQLLGKKNPVATLATLILLSYTKLLQAIITALSVTTLKYPDGHQERVWLPDASVDYLQGKHVPLFIIAVLILSTGVVYTILLFSWQWLLRYQDMTIFRWVRWQKLRLFLEPYHAPYTFKHRYWTGLLLLVRVVLYVTSAVNIDNDPRINLLAIGLIISGIIILKGSISGVRVYKYWTVDILEMACHFNVILVTLVSMFCIETSESKRFISTYISVAVVFVLLISVLLFHLLTESPCLNKIWRIVKKRMGIKCHDLHGRSHSNQMTDSFIAATLDNERSFVEDHRAIESEAYYRREAGRNEGSCSDSGESTSPLPATY